MLIYVIQINYTYFRFLYNSDNKVIFNNEKRKIRFVNNENLNLI